MSYNPKILKSQISCFAVLAWTPHFRILLQIFTRCIQVFIGPSHMGEHPTGFSQGPPSRAAFLQVSLKNLFLMFTYHFFFSLQPSKPPPKDTRFQWVLTSIFTHCFSTSNKISFLEIFPHSLEHPLKVHAVSIDPNIPPLRELGIQRIYL